MSLPEEYRGDSSYFLLLPISYEKDVTFGTGAAKGPAAIISASKHLEYYDEQFDVEAFEGGIRVLDALELSEKSPEEMVERVGGAVPEGFVIGLGGDHAVTIGMVRGLENHHKEFSVIQFDAHADFRDSWNGSANNHACVARQISKSHEVLQIGIRSMDVDEKRLMDGAQNVHTIKAYEFSVNRILELLPKLKEKVYITIDVDAFDPSVISHTGTPEPGGMLWNQVIETLELIFKEKIVIGADICEFSPKEGSEAQAYTLAKLAYKIMSLEWRTKQSN